MLLLLQYLTDCFEWLKRRSSNLKIWQVFVLFFLFLWGMVLTDKFAPDWIVAAYNAASLPFMVFLMFGIWNAIGRFYAEQERQATLSTTKKRLKNFRR